MAEVRLPSTEALRRSALGRSTQRGARVARRRIALRWFLWGAWLLLRWAGLPALLLAGLLFALYRDPARPTRDDVPATPLASPPAGASQPGLHLRLDEDDLTQNAPPPAPRRAQSDASPHVDDRSPSER